MGENVVYSGHPCVPVIRVVRVCDAAVPGRHPRLQSSQPAPAHGVALPSIPSHAFLPGVSPTSNTTNVNDTDSRSVI